ncbi:hypothetical protein IM40_05610 [Candidatus Paracaedimonas acanthamoebae]|nr:hypothetical protein IM40_05610 [Candidatus Paracaedimonas acanthamoebae]
MKNVISVFAVSTLTFLAACEHNPSWDRDCNANYSVNDRELARCKEKMKAHESTSTDSNAVTVDATNTQSPTLERLGKAHDRNKND